MASENLQFDKAEGTVATQPAAIVCAECAKPIPDYYYETAGHTLCGTCKRTIESAAAKSRFKFSSFLRAAVFGLVGAAGGAAVYFGVLAATGYEIGLIAILVGYMVGYMVRRGAGGRSGRSYQVLAFALTYLAISATYFSLAMREIIQNDQAVETADSASLVAQVSSQTPVQDSAPQTDAKPASAGLVLGSLVVLALAMPVLAGFAELPSSLISLLIVSFALIQAWQMNKALVLSFSGPYRVGAPRQDAASAA